MNDYLNRFKESFIKDKIYFGSEKIDSIDIEIGYLKEFRLSWFATQLNTFIAVGRVENEITKETIDDYSDKIFNFSIKNHKGWPRGFQAGVGSIAVLIGNNVHNGAIEYCKKLTKKHWSAFEIPVIVDLKSNTLISFDRKPIWGTIYFPYLKKLIEEKIGGVIKDTNN
jgi:hypothetical protein